MNSPILAPVIALVLWSFVMWAWMYATRIPAMFKHKVTYDPHRPATDSTQRSLGLMSLCASCTAWCRP